MAPEANEGIERIQLEGVEPWTPQSIAICHGVTASIGAVTGDGTSRLVVVTLDPDELEDQPQGEDGNCRFGFYPYVPYAEKLAAVEAYFGKRHVATLSPVFGEGGKAVVAGRISVVLEMSKQDLSKGLGGLMQGLLPPAQEEG